jgi:phospholipid/cholesterol/gamma-HCH transport system ATP-binding protein
MQKRAALARAIAIDPEIIFFDEPTTGLDPIMSAVIDDLIISCAKSQGATNVIITHDLRTVGRVADKVAMLHEGKIIWYDDASKLYKSGNSLVDKFVKP